MAQQISDELAALDAADLRFAVSPRDRPARRPDAVPGLTVVLPCFNEADNVAGAIRAATAAAERCARTHQIVVVDDGSTDSTATIVAALAARDPRVHLVVHARNQGYGDAVRSGIAAATKPWTLLTDADLQFELDQLAEFLPLTGTADMIVGWRIARSDPLNRRLNAAAWNWLVRGMFALPVRDVDCAFKLVRTDFVQRLELRSSGAMISTELLARGLRGGARLEQLGVRHHPRLAGEQSGASPRVILRAFRELLAVRRTLRGARVARRSRDVHVGGSTVR
jgi:glycosyltransferase involved in cell wall biosynthesis